MCDLSTQNTRTVAKTTGSVSESRFAVFSPADPVLLDGFREPELWNLGRWQAEPALTTSVPFVDGFLKCGGFSADGQEVIFALSNGQLLIWDRAALRLKVHVTCGYDLSQLAWSPDARLVAGLSQDTFARIWQIEALTGFSELELLGALQGLTLSNDGGTLAVWDEDVVALWDTEREVVALSTLFERSSENNLNACFSYDGTQLLVSKRHTVSAKGFLERWNLAFSSPERLIAVDSDEVIVSLTCFSSGPLVALGLHDESIRVWDSQQDKVLKTLTGHQGEIERLLVSANDAWLVSGCSDGTARVWETAGYALRGVLKGQLGPVMALCLAPDSTFVVIGDFGGNILLWNLPDNPALLAGFVLSVKQPGSQPLTCLDISPDGRYIVAADRTGQVVFWRREAGGLRMVGSYSTVYPVRAIHWSGARQVLLIDQGGTTGRPYFYRLELRGEGW